MLRAMKDGRTILTTAKMFTLIYHEQGYELEDESVSISPGKPLAELSLAELRTMAKSKGFANTSKLKAPELIAMLTLHVDENNDVGQSDDKQSDDESGGDDGYADNTDGTPAGTETPPQP